MQARDLLLFNTADKKVNISVYFQNGTFWLTQKAMAELFGVNVPAINKHLRNIYETGELNREATVSFLEIVQKEGKRNVERSVEFYRLKDKGKVTMLEAKIKAGTEYEKFRVIQDQTYESDFDREVKTLKV